MNRDLRRLFEEKVVVFDGGLGTMLQRANLDPDDFAGLDGCNELLVRTRPDVVKAIHAAYFAAGSDVVETNSFGSNGVVLAEYGIADQAYDLSRQAAVLARAVAADCSTPDRPRFVAGSIGPGTKLPSLGHIGYVELRDAFEPQARGLLDGGADALIIETCQDLLQVKVALDAVRRACQASGRSVPVLLSLTIEASGTMLVGADLAAALAALIPLGVDSIGLNCATGPDAMKRHAQALGLLGPRHLSAMPNAGLPQNVGGRFVYPMGPVEFADWVESFVKEDGVGIVGGCCGSTPEHIAEVVARVGGLAAPRRTPSRRAEASSLYQAVSFRQEPPPLLIGERTNANGSREFRDRLLADDLDGMLAVAREQERGGAHLLDVCVAYVGRDERADLARLVPELARQVKLPLVIDSTDPLALEVALQRHGGRCVINSINLEDGPARPNQVLELARRHGAAVVALTIDEQGMALTTERKLAVAERLYQLAVHDHGLAPEDLILDLLTFTVGSGDEGMRPAAAATLAAIEAVKQRWPGVHTSLGVSNVSFGLTPALRRVLNSVFLAEAVARGLDMAIVNARGIVPLHRIPAEVQDACRRLLLADWSQGDPLAELLGRFASEASGGVVPGSEAVGVAANDEDRLQRQVIDGVRTGVGDVLDRLLAAGWGPIELVNELLIPAMKIVGDLFGAGRLQLPFVLQAAEVMKAAVHHLEPHMEAIGGGASRGTLVLATVKGDVHDIGKNLVDIILTNNGFRVVNLGIKVPVEQMLAAVTEQRADALGMSGLLVKSTVVMKENLEELVRRGVRLPVLLGGAALTRQYVEQELRTGYGPTVHYAEDAFDGLRLMTELCERAPAAGQAAAATPAAPPTPVAPSTPAAPVPAPAPAAAAGVEPDPLSRPRHEWPRQLTPATPGPAAVYTPPPVARDVEVPVPPFFGTRLVEDIPLDEVFALLNETTLFRGQWRYRRGLLDREAYARLIDEQVRPTLARWQARCRAEGLLRPQGVVGYFACHAEGEQVVVHDPAAPGRELARFTFPRRRVDPHHCIADFFRAGPTAQPDLIGLFAVTVGSAASRLEKELFEGGEYKDYLHLHGLSVEAAEATAEWLHARIRRELGIAEADQSGLQAMVRQGYRGSRYSFGYPACPELAEQATLFALLQPERLGIQLTEGFQMVPEQSVTALVVHHPEAKYFDLG